MTRDDSNFIDLLIAEAKKCNATGDNPLVGALAVADEELLGSAYRGEIEPGDHAEFILLERKLKDKSLAGCTVYTTLEPCTSRGSTKIPCAFRLIERKVGKVVIGMLDPNPVIRGRGVLALNSAGIDTELLPKVHRNVIEELNRSFIRAHTERTRQKLKGPPPGFVDEHRGRRLNDWYDVVNTVYRNLLFHRDAMQVFVHLVEVVGALSLVASDKRKPRVDPNKFVIKAIGWWLSLCGRIRIRSVEDILWKKFPGVCPYCLSVPHAADECDDIKKRDGNPNWDKLAEIGKKEHPPQSLGEWQRMFARVYPPQPTASFGMVFARLSEELGELAEAIRVFPVQPGYFLSEAADVFAWLMHLQNLLEQRQGVPREHRGEAIETIFCETYPDFCIYCSENPCSCPPIVAQTVGRIAKEAPLGSGAYEELGMFMTPEIANARFKQRSTEER